MTETTEELRAKLLSTIRDEVVPKLKKPIPRLVEIRPFAKHKLFVRFSDGIQGVYDVSQLLDLPAFRPLRNPTLFARVIGEESPRKKAGKAGLRKAR
jgi:hypothetical protein